MDFSYFIEKLRTKIKIIIKVIRNIDDVIDELLSVIELLEDSEYMDSLEDYMNGEDQTDFYSEGIL